MVKHDEIIQAVQDRRTWEDRQEVWYRMRHDGLRRANKPWKNAADMHFPLVDMTIEKLKPYYVQQLYATDTIATFYSLSPALVGHQVLAAQWFDWQLRQNSNLETEIPAAIDSMLMSGRAAVKVYWDSEAEQIRFEAISPTALIVPAWTKKLEDADWIVHVQQFSQAAYGRRKDFDQEVLKSIAGADSYDAKEQTKKLREGVTYSKNADVVIVWEVFWRDEAGDWHVRTYSPAAPTKLLRPDFVLPYNKGVFGKRKVPPFGDLPCEIKEQGYYSPRGIAERLAGFEQSLNHDWNTIKDYQTLTCNPVFSAQNAPPNTSNIRFRPGDVYGYEIQAVQFPPIPMDLQQSMNTTRLTAEQSVTMPDFGTSQPQTGKPRTATEISVASNMMGQSVDLRARIFRRGMTHLLNLAWSLAVQYMADKLQFFATDQLGEIPKDALSDAYQIELAGSPENFNRMVMLQKATARFQMFNNDQRIDQDELRRSVLEIDDPRLVRRLFRPSQEAAANQAQRQAEELAIMKMGFPAQVRPDDDHQAHVQVLMAYAQRLRANPEPVAPDAVQAMMQHAQAHLQGLGQTNPQAAQQLAQQLQAMMGGGQPQPQQPQMQQMPQQPQMPPRP